MLYEKRPNRLHLRAPDVACVLLNPSLVGEGAVERNRVHPDALAPFVIKRGARAGGAFIEGQDVTHW